MTGPKGNSEFCFPEAKCFNSSISRAANVSLFYHDLQRATPGEKPCTGSKENHRLRTVPTKYKGFCARLGPRGKSRSLPGLLESTKKNRGSHAFFRDN